MKETSTTLMSWNIQSGGFSGYSPDAPDERGARIAGTVEAARRLHGIESVSLIDAHRWEYRHGGEDGIARHLGFAAARFVRLEDDRLTRTNGANIGIAFATDSRIEQSAVLDLETRQGLGVILNLGGKSLQLASVYLDDLNEDVRISQLRALNDALEPDVPTVLLGDFNLLRPDFGDVPLPVRLRDLGVRSLAAALGSRSELGKSISGMNERRAYGYASMLGFTDADVERKRPTAPARLPLFGIDYAFSRGSVGLSEPILAGNPSASDHRALVTTATIAG